MWNKWIIITLKFIIYGQYIYSMKAATCDNKAVSSIFLIKQY